MATNPVDHFWGSANQDSGSVPPVDPADIRSVWTMQSQIQAVRPGEQIGISADAYHRACGPGADVRAVFERVSPSSIIDVGAGKSSLAGRSSSTELLERHKIPRSRYVPVGPNFRGLSVFSVFIFQ
jgi:hypothetical protein